MVDVFIAGVDLDLFTVDSTARAARATKPDGKLDWTVMFDPQLILELDKPIPHMLEKLEKLKAQGLTIWYITSREESTLQATIAWLRKENYPDPDNVICRVKFTKKLEFKPNAVLKLHQERGRVVLFADDEPENLEAVRKLNITGLTVQDHLDFELGA